MREATRPGIDCDTGLHQSPIDLVVPFTTPELTRVAVEAAARMGADLNARLRLVRIQVIPVQLDLCQSPVEINFLKEQMAAFQPDVDAVREVRFARDFEEGLQGALNSDSVVLLAARRRPWKTKNERRAAALRNKGYRVIVVGNQHA